MTRKHTCSTCGYEDAVWMLRISTSNLTLCENCLSQFYNKYSHIHSFRLRKEERHEVHTLSIKQIKHQASIQDRTPAGRVRTHRHRKNISLRKGEGQ